MPVIIAAFRQFTREKAKSKTSPELGIEWISAVSFAKRASSILEQTNSQLQQLLRIRIRLALGIDA